MNPNQEASAVDVIEGQERDRAEAGRISALLPSPAEPGAFAVLVGPNRKRVELPAPVYRVLHDAVGILSRGDTIVIGSLDQELTTTRAADLLGVSRQYLTRLVDRGELRHQMVGKHRRLRLGDVLAYKSQRALQRRAALSKMSALDVELGAYD
jgi:excisionase family DNA binding protein